MSASPSTMLWVLRHPWWVILGSLLAVGLAGSGGRFLRFSNDIRVFFSPDNPQLKAYEALERTYARADSILFVLAPHDGNVFTRHTLASIERLTAAAWRLPYARRVDALTNFQHTAARGDDVVVAPLVTEAETLRDTDLERVRQIALQEPLLVHRLISPTGHVTGVNVSIHLPGQASLTELPQVAAAARQLADQVRHDNPALAVSLTGTVMLNSALSETGMHDMQTLMPLVFLVVLVSLGALLRTLTGTLVALLVIVLCLIATVGLVGWLGIVLSPPVVSAPVVIMTLAVAHCVHLLEACLLGLRRGLEKRVALAESLRHNMHPMFLTSSTTILGFLSLNTSDSPPFRDFGNMVALGVAVAWGLAIILLPALTMVLPLRVPSGSRADGRLMERCCAFVLRHRQGLFWGMTTLTLGLGLGILRNELNDDFVKYFDAHVPFRRATDFAMTHLTGFNFIEYSLSAGEPGGIAEPAYLRTVEAFAQWYRQQPRVRHVYAFTDILKRLHQNMHGDDPAWYRLPEQRELVAQYVLLYESSLPPGLEVNDHINIEKSATLVRVSLDSITTQEMLRLEESARAWLQQHAPPSMQAPGSGQPLVFAHISARNISGLLLSTTLELILISLLLIFGLRSWKFGLLSLIPNLVPAVMAYGLWGFAVGRIGMALSVVVGITLGIVVDDTIYVMSTYMQARRAQGLPPEEAIRYTFVHVGPAVWFTSLILIAGFAVLSFSKFEINAGMGLLSAITIAIAGLAEVFFLPPLLLYAERQADGKGGEGAMGASSALHQGCIMLALALCLLGLGLLPRTGYADTAEERGLAIVTEANRRDTGWGDATADLTMVLRNQAGQESTRVLRVRFLEGAGDGNKSLVLFEHPADVKGTALLTHAHKTQDDDQWLYLPALKRVKRIAAAHRAGSFMGSEFAYEDLSGQEIARYTYKYLRDEVYEGRPSFVIARYPVDKSSGYTRQIAWLDQAEYRLWKVEYYDRKQALLKTLTLGQYAQYLGRYWRPAETLMHNHQSGKSTLLTFTHYRLHTGLRDSDFHPSGLEQVR